MLTLITPLRIRKSGNGLTPKMVNPLNKPFSPGFPVFLVDRKITDFQKVVSINMKNVQKIEFYNTLETLQRFGEMGKNGVVIIHTWLPEPFDMSKTAIVHGIQTARNYPVKVNPNKDKRTPMLDPVIYWNPSIRTDENGEISMSFYHNDGIGQFEVILFGRSKKGDWCQDSVIYEVKP